jgi:hypothetical protein
MIQREGLRVLQNLSVDLKKLLNIRKVPCVASYANVYGPVNSMQCYRAIRFLTTKPIISVLWWH